MPTPLEEQILEHIKRTGDQACVQVVVSLDLIDHHDDVKTALDKLTADGLLRRYMPKNLEYLHLEQENILFYGIPREQHEPISIKEILYSIFK